MNKSLIRRASGLVLVLALVGSAFVRFHSTVLAQGDFGYMCNAWEESCDNGSGGSYGGPGSGAGGTGGWVCPDSQTCGNFGCHARSIADPTQICSRYNLEGVPGNCSSPANCTR